MKNELKLFLRNINTEQFAFFESVFKENEPINLKGNVSFSFNEIDHFIACSTHFEFLHDSVPFMAIQVMCEFEIEANSWQQFINKENTEMEIPVDVLKHLISLNIGVSRGILHSKTEFLKRPFILPLLDLNSLAKQSLKHKIVKKSTRK